MSRDTGLDVLLELNGTEYTEESGYWYREDQIMTETIEVGIMPREQFQRRLLDIAAGSTKPRHDDPKIWFSSINSMAQVLNENNIRLLNLIRERQPKSIRELELLSGRASSNISRTLKTLESHGIVKMRKGEGNARYPVATLRRVNISIDFDTVS